MTAKTKTKKVGSEEAQQKLRLAKQTHSTAAALATELKHRARAAKDQLREARKKFKTFRRMARSAAKDEAAARKAVADLVKKVAKAGKKSKKG